MGGPPASDHTAPVAPATLQLAVFDFDGTLVDSDAALRAPFEALGIDPEVVPLGLPLVEACDLVGISTAEYLAHYDATAVEPFPGVNETLAALEAWALCSNKQRASGHAELRRLGWTPAAAMFSDDFGGAPKRLGPVLDQLGIAAAAVVFVGDTEHDRLAAADAGATFALAGWNPRAQAMPHDLVLRRPEDLLDLLAD